jgi:antitoxin HicB
MKAAEGRRRRAHRREAVVKLEIERLKEGGYVATSADVPGLVAQGRTIAEVVEIAQDVARRIAESCVEHGDPLPPAFRRAQSRSFPLSIPVGLPGGE